MKITRKEYLIIIRSILMEMMETSMDDFSVTAEVRPKTLVSALKKMMNFAYSGKLYHDGNNLEDVMNIDMTQDELDSLRRVFDSSPYLKDEVDSTFDDMGEKVLINLNKQALIKKDND